jgi:hypothetical protein
MPEYPPALLGGTSLYPDQEIKERYTRVEGREFSRTLNIPLSPEQNDFKECGMEVGKILDFNLKVITKGTCIPLLFDFLSISL